MNSTSRSLTIGRRRDQPRRHTFAPVVGFAALALVAALVPPVMLAAEGTVETQRNAVVVFVVLVLLVGSVTAGLIFASPLRRRLISSPTVDDAPSGLKIVGNEPTAEPRNAHHAWPAAGKAAPMREAVPAPTTPAVEWVPARPLPGSLDPGPASQQPSEPLVRWPEPTPAQQPSREAAQPTVSPWSTNPPRPDSNWNPDRRSGSGATP